MPHDGHRYELIDGVLVETPWRFDLTLKRSRFEAAGVSSYWVMDPMDVSLRAWDLVDGSFVEVANVEAGAAWTARLPFEVTIEPAQRVSDY